MSRRGEKPQGRRPESKESGQVRNARTLEERQAQERMNPDRKGRGTAFDKKLGSHGNREICSKTRVTNKLAGSDAYNTL